MTARDIIRTMLRPSWGSAVHPEIGHISLAEAADSQYPPVPPREAEPGERYEGNSWGWVLPDGQFLQAFMSHPDLAAQYLADAGIVPLTTNKYGIETLDYEAAMQHAVENDWIRTWGIHTIALPDRESANWERARRWLLREKPLKRWDLDETVQVYVVRDDGYGTSGSMSDDYEHIATLGPREILHWSPSEATGESQNPRWLVRRLQEQELDLLKLPDDVWNASLEQVLRLFQNPPPEEEENYDVWDETASRWARELFPDYVYTVFTDEREVVDAVENSVERFNNDGMVELARTRPEYIQAALHRIKQAMLYGGWGSKNPSPDHPVRQEFTFPEIPEHLVDDIYDNDGETSYEDWDAARDAAGDPFELALLTFGETESPYAAGYILPDGRMVDFSEGSGSRTLDHRAIERVMAMQDFMALGAIRVSLYPGSSAMIDMVKEPTSNQYAVVRDFVDLANGDVVVDLEDGLGPYDERDGYYRPASRRASESFDDAHPRKVISWIRSFY